MYDRDWGQAERDFKRAIGLQPSYETAHHWYAELLAGQERYAEAIAEAQRAQKVSPLSLVVNWNVGQIFYLARQFDQAIEQCRKTLDLDPHGCNFALMYF